MTTEAIRENFTKWRDSDFKERFNKLSFVGFAPSMAQASNFAWMGYQQAVKDVDGKSYTENYINNLKSERANAMREVAELTKQRDELEDSLLSLLAIVHRDGGHYVADHGIGRAVNDAILKVAANNSVIDEALSTQGDSDG